MYEFDQEYLDKTSDTNVSDRASLIRWLAKQGEATMIEAMRLQGDLVHQNQSKRVKAKNPEFFFAMLTLALQKMRWLETAPAQKIALTSDDNKKLRAIRLARIKARHNAKEAPQRALIRIRYYEEIKLNRAEGLSWRDISKYIHTHHKKAISASYIQRVFAELTAEREALSVDD